MNFILLKELNSSWESFSLFRKWISRLFHHYNKNTELHYQKSLHTNFLSIEEFKNKVFFEFRYEIVSSLCKLLQDIRGFYFVSISEKMQALISGREIVANDDSKMQEEAPLGSELRDQIGMDEEDQGLEEKILIMKKTLNLFTQILLEKTNERNIVFTQINEKFITESRLFFKKNLEGKKLLDCRSYLEFSKKLKATEEQFFARVFEGNDSMQYIHDNLRRVFYDSVLKSYVQELITNDFGFVYLLKELDYEVRISKFAKMSLF